MNRFEERLRVISNTLLLLSDTAETKQLKKKLEQEREEILKEIRHTEY